MNRKEIKELAKEKIKGNKWNLIWPMLVISVISSIISRIFGGPINFDFSKVESLTSMNYSPMQYGGNILSTLVTGLLSAGFMAYVLNFVRKGNFDTNKIIETIKAKWVNILIATILVMVILALSFCLLVIPGIIMSLAYAMVIFLVIDTDVAGSDSLKASREMMKGYKWDYFVFCLSFIGWILLIPLTFGIILIWLYPYMLVAKTIYYDKLKNIKK